MEFALNMGEGALRLRTRRIVQLKMKFVHSTVDLVEIKLANWRQDKRRDHGSDGPVKGPKDRGQGSRIGGSTMTVQYSGSLSGCDVRSHKPNVQLSAIKPFTDKTIDFFRQHLQNPYKHGRLYRVGLRLLSSNKGSI